MTQITPQNYLEQTAKLRPDNLPKKLADGHEYTQQYLPLYGETMTLAEANKILRQIGSPEMEKNIEVGEFIDGHIATLNAHLKSTPAQAVRKKAKPSQTEAAEWQDALETLELLISAGGSPADLAEWQEAAETLKLLL